MPARNPTAAGTTLSRAISIDGISSDHTLAATITPLANPSSVFCSRSGMSFFMKKTNADPSIVPIKGINIPMITAFMTLNNLAAKIQNLFQIQGNSIHSSVFNLLSGKVAKIVFCNNWKPDRSLSRALYTRLAETNIPPPSFSSRNSPRTRVRDDIQS